MVIIGAPSPLAVRFAADRLTGLELRWLEDLLTIATTPFDHTGVVPLKTDQGKSFRNCCRVGTASSPMAVSSNNKTGGNAVVLDRR